jgi:hypothetical protein
VIAMKNKREPGIEIAVTQELIDEAMHDGLSGCELIALALARSIPGARDIVVTEETISFTLDGDLHTVGGSA